MERKYQIFISSTYVDLIKERESVTMQILKNYHFPIGMEMFSASDKKQWHTIKATIDSSDIYVLIVGHRYGSKDGDVSFTEKEYNYAVEKKKPILVFVNNDNITSELNELKLLTADKRIDPETNEDLLELFYKNKYDYDQSNILKFREKVMTERIVGFFNKNKPIDIQDAISKKIKEIPNKGWVRQHYFFQPKYFAFILTLLIISIYLFIKNEITPIQKRLSKQNQELFYSAKDSNIEYARVIPDANSLLDETNLGETFRSTQDSFYIISNAVKVFYDYANAIDSCAKRGVHFKILLVDTATENQGKINYFNVYNPDSLREKIKKVKMISDFNNSIELLHNIKERIIKEKYKGDIQVLLYSKPVYYQMWIKDPMSKDGLAHFNIAHWDGFKPHFRVTPQSSKKLFKYFTNEFNFYWNDPENKVIM